MKKKQRRVVFWIILAALFVAAAVMIFFGTKKVAVAESTEIPQVGEAVHAPPATPRPSPTEVPGLEAPVNILLIGIDNFSGSTEGARGNADGIMFATLNPLTREFILTSFLRDTRVRVNDSYYDKITNVYHTGDVALLRETLEQNFEVPIDYYVIFGYPEVAALVDAVGGVDVELSAQEIYSMEGKIIDIAYMLGENYQDYVLNIDQEGLNHLNGIQAAAYTRIRPAEGGYDVGRTERGRDVVMKVLEKAFAMNSGDMLQLADVFYNQLETDIPDALFIQLGLNASELKKYKQVSDHIPIEDSYESGNTGSGYYVIPDFEINNKHLQESLFEGIHS